MTNVLQTIIALISIFGFVCSAGLYLKTRVEKTYAAQRDFQHVKNSLSQFSQSLGTFSEEHEEIQDELKEIKGIVTSFSQRLDFILTHVELNSGVFGQRRDPQG